MNQLLDGKSGEKSGNCKVQMSGKDIIIHYIAMW